MNLLTKTSLPFLAVCVFLLFYSCKKEVNFQKPQDVPNHKLETEDETIIKVTQAIAIDDGTGLADSAAFVNPPTNRYYEWEILPNNGCTTLWGQYKYGKANITFNCSGIYQVSAAVYDSATHRLIAQTDTVQINVTKDTLHPSQPLLLDDGLMLHTTIIKDWSQPTSTNNPPGEVYLSMDGKTIQNYEEFDWGNWITAIPTKTDNDYSFVFSDSVQLSSYPFARSRSSFQPASTQIAIKGMKIGVPINLHITWLGKTYTGKVTLIDEDHYSVDWDNSGSVKID